MSAIFGVLRRDGGAVEERALEAMARILAHRGPDGSRVLALDNAGLGHCLMRVTREDRLEAQPLHDPAAGVTLVADLRLDNREALASELGIGDDALAQMADSDVLLAAWRHWGDACLGKLIGDFTIALRDHRARRLYLARDGMGQRGLYLHAGEQIVAFASEIPALFALPEVPRALSEAGIARRLLVPVDPDPDVTLYDGVTYLPGGNLRWFDDAGGGGERRFWEPQAAPEHLGKDNAYYLEAYRAVVTEAIACRVRRLEKPPCLMFSGGFDSGTIAAVAAPIMAARGQAMIAVTSVLNEGESSPRGDSRALAEAFAGMPGLALHTVSRGEDSLLTRLEESFARSGECVTFNYVRAAGFALGRREGARLAMDGHGGDYTVNMLDAGMLGRILRRGHLRRFWRELRARRAFTRRSLAAILYGDVLRPLVPQRLMRAIFDWRDASVPLWQRRYVQGDFALRHVAGGMVDPRRLRHPRVAWQRWQARWLHMQRMMMLGPPTPATIAAAQGLDFTRPFHDIRIVALALAIPEHLQFRDGRERWLARTALADCLPPSLIARQPGNTPERPGQEAMFAQSLPAALAMLEEAGPESPAARYVDVGKLRAAVTEAGSSREGRSNPIATSGAANAMLIARFVNWFSRGNGPSQEP
ncbi:MAG: asparagine synthase-related protein [Erythrobacter sp.]|uniref:asparagine synthetase B family protein n=1 Tax=Erythrobacter sp. TaxID=1042 RepID=UPI0025E31D87|nr:asparagine synthase-related protein [Erythrobacter sp.]MCL9999653.1 asparagine synthase-related protein [Erythrobacter sp.]